MTKNQKMNPTVRLMAMIQGRTSSQNIPFLPPSLQCPHHATCSPPPTAPGLRALPGSCWAHIFRGKEPRATWLPTPDVADDSIFQLVLWRLAFCAYLRFRDKFQADETGRGWKSKIENCWIWSVFKINYLLPQSHLGITLSTANMANQRPSQVVLPACRRLTSTSRDAASNQWSSARLYSHIWQ